MPWPTPNYSKKAVNRAGETLLRPDSNLEQWIDAYQALTNWRACHGYPINTFQATLRNKLKRTDSSAVVAQRLKRFPSILSKLRRFEGMKLSRMQDIGGLRAVVTSVKDLRALEESYRSSRFEHELLDCDDYIEQPKRTGYRSLHLIYKYRNPRAPAYDGLMVELQFRTKLQHAWATAVETMGTLLNHSLKSSEGPDIWLRFFSLAGAAFAHLEGCPRVPGFEHLERRETYQLTADMASQLQVTDKLKGYTTAVDQIPHFNFKAGYYLLVLDISSHRVKIEPFARANLDEANAKYAAIEGQASGGTAIQAVLVSATSLDNLRKAYPNFFLDTNEFVRRLGAIIRSSVKDG
jgi:ppGpp synthetase/RelA/SpoT-type nucleotidyltranferase